MSRFIAFACAFLLLAAGLASCGGGGKGEGAKKQTKTVAFTQVSHFGATLKIPQGFPRAGGEKNSVTYARADGSAMISIERIPLNEGKELDDYYAVEFEKRMKDANKAKKSTDAYKILKSNKISIGGKEAREIEQEFFAGAGTQKSHNIVVIVAIGEAMVLAITWEVPDLALISWPKAHSTYLKESRESLSLN
jgi:hypothetical protein